MKNVNIIIDGSNLAYRHFFAIQKASITDVNSVIAFGFIRSLIKLKREFKQADFWVAWDRTAELKKELFPKYKAQREDFEGKEELYSYIDILREVLPYAGIGCIRLLNQEADDIIGTLVVKYFKDDLNYIYANDRDYLQLVKDGSVIVLFPKKGKYKAYDEEAVEDEFGVSTDAVPHFRALDGDTADNIPRVPYLKKKTIAEIINRYGSVYSLYDSTFTGISIKDYNKLKPFEKQAKLNLQLIQLNTSLELESFTKKPPFDISKLEEMFEKYNLDTISILNELQTEFGGKKAFMKTGVQKTSL